MSNSAASLRPSDGFFSISSLHLFLSQALKPSYGNYNSGFYCPTGRRTAEHWNRDAVHGGAHNDFRHTLLIQGGIGRRKYLVGLKYRAEEEDERPWFYAPFANRIEEALHLLAQGGLAGIGREGQVSMRHRHLLLQALGAGAPTAGSDASSTQGDATATGGTSLGRAYTGQGASKKE